MVVKDLELCFVYAIGEATQTDKLILDHIASSIEFIHAYSLNS